MRWRDPRALFPGFSSRIIERAQDTLDRIDVDDSAAVETPQRRSILYRSRAKSTPRGSPSSPLASAGNRSRRRRNAHTSPLPLVGSARAIRMERRSRRPKTFQLRRSMFGSAGRRPNGSPLSFRNAASHSSSIPEKPCPLRCVRDGRIVLFSSSLCGRVYWLRRCDE